MSEVRDQPERWPELDHFFERLLDADGGERQPLLEEIGRSDPDLRAELELLLAAHTDALGFLDDPGPWIGSLSDQDVLRSAVTDRDRFIGRTMGRFRVLERLGEGGMGVVYRARDTRLDRIVALKLLNAPARSIPGAEERLEREARAASALDHANICTILDIGETRDGVIYIAMPYYSGETLRERLSRGPMELEELLEVGIGIGRGLAAAHRAGIVHRDLKPANVLLTEDGELKVLDFGIAKREGTSDLTQTGALLGTVAYMSPEQATGGPVDHRTDIWSLGVTLYQARTGQLPFQGGTDVSTLDMILRTAPAASDAIPPGLDAVLRRAMTKDPDERYPSMGSMVEDLRSLAGADGRPGQAIPKGIKPRSRRVSWIAAGAVATALAGATLVAGPWGLAPVDPVLEIPQGPAIAVVPFENVGPDPEREYFARGLTEDLMTSLARFSDLLVFSSEATAPYAGATPDVAAIESELGPQFVLVGSIQQAQGRVRVTVRLLDTETQRAEWSEIFDHDLTAAGLFAAQDEITERVAGTLGGSGGLIGRGLATATRNHTERLDSYECVLRSYDYLINHSPTNHEIARSCLEQVVDVDPSYVDAWGWLAYAYAEESRHAWNRRDAYDPLERALETAEHAIRLEPTNFIGQASLAVTRFDRHEVALFLDAAERAMALNPNDATWLAVFGGYYAEIGEWDRGMAILDKARALNPNHPSWIFGDYALNEYRQGNYEEALAFALRINLPDYYRGFIWRIAAYGQLGRRDEAQEAYARVVELRPDLVDEASVRRDFQQYNHPDDVLDHVFEGLRNSGIWEDE